MALLSPVRHYQREQFTGVVLEQTSGRGPLRWQVWRRGFIVRWAKSEEEGQKWLVTEEATKGGRATVLQERDLDVLHFVAQYEARHLFGPTVREIAAGVHVPSLNTVARALQKLRDKGLVVWEPYRSRTLRIVYGGQG